MPGVGDYLMELMGQKKPVAPPPPPPPPPVDPTAGMNLQQKMKYGSWEAQKARQMQAQAAAAQAAKTQAIKSINPVEPSQNWFMKLLGQ